MRDFLTGKKHVHFIGIGGSGMYPLAQILHSKGFYITGSDNNETATLDAVRKMGIKVFLGHSADNLIGADLIVHTAAIMADNPELIAAKASGVETIERSVLLGLVSSWYKNAVCVSGTHGKTTATSMLTHIYLADKVDLSAFIGGKLKAIGGSGILGSSETMVIEACEFSHTFLKLDPNTAVILNIDEDHMEYFKTLDNLILAFTDFCNLTSDLIVYNGDDENSIKAVKNSTTNAKKVTFGYGKHNDFYASDINIISDFHTEFKLNYQGKSETISISVPGKHNVLNATAAIATALSQGVSLASAKEGLIQYKGTGRRFELLDVVNGVTVADDYAHHPAEVAATLNTAKSMSFKRVWAVHQPFTYSRTFRLLDDFASALSIADNVVLTEIMGSREKNTLNIYSKDLAEKIEGCQWFAQFEDVADYVANNVKEGDLVITLGCGDVYKVAEMIVKSLKQK